MHVWGEVLCSTACYWLFQYTQITLCCQFSGGWGQNPIPITVKADSWSTDPDRDLNFQVAILQLDAPHPHLLQQLYVYISVKDVSVYSTLSFTRESNPASGPRSFKHMQSKDFTALWLL